MKSWNQNMGQTHHASTAIDIPISYTNGVPMTGGYNGGNEDGARL
jgi:hypothetical protein